MTEASGQTLKGACVCGACSFTATPVSTSVAACHCGMCRKWSGGMYFAVDCGTSVAFADGAPLGSYKGSEWGDRVFCKGCGSSLMWQMQDGTFQHVSMQAFDDPSQFVLDHEIFIDRKPDNYALANETKKTTEAEVFAMFADAGEA